MDSKIKLKEVLSTQSDKKEKEVREEVQLGDIPFHQEPKTGFFEQKRKSKIANTIAEEKLSLKDEVLVKKDEKEKKRFKTATQVGDENLKAIQARKLQMMTQTTNREPALSSPLQMHLVQSDSLRIAQEKISDLEEELLSLREKNESLISAGETLRKNNESLKIKIEDAKSNLKDEKKSFEEEKGILLSALESAREQLGKLRSKKQELEKRISSNFYGIRQRESSLEGRIEILKMENSALQKEKDKKILELRKDIQKLKYNLENSRKKNSEIKLLNSKLKESSRRAVSALRATIYNLEGAKMNEETIVSQASNHTKAS